MVSDVRRVPRVGARWWVVVRDSSSCDSLVVQKKDVQIFGDRYRACGQSLHDGGLARAVGPQESVPVTIIENHFRVLICDRGRKGVEKRGGGGD